MFRRKQIVVFTAALFILLVSIHPVSALQNKEAVNNKWAGQSISKYFTSVNLFTSPALPDVLAANIKQETTWLSPRFSRDGGRLWTDVKSTPWNDDSGFPTTYVDQLDVAIASRNDPQNPLRVLVAVSGAEEFPPSVWGTKLGIYRTGDYGKSWAFRTLSSMYYPCLWRWVVSFSDFRISLVNPHLLTIGYSVNGEYDYVCPPFPPIIVSTPRTNHLYSESGSLISFDDGITWTEHRNIQSIVPSPVIVNRLYGFDTDHFVMSDDGGVNWVPRAFPVDILVPDSVNPDLLYGYQGNIGYTSPDSGDKWNSWTDQPCPDVILQLVTHPQKTKEIFLRCSSGIFRSVNGGEDWIQISLESGQFLAPDLGNSNRFYWAKDDDLWGSIDEGDTWELLSEGFINHRQFLSEVVK